MKKIKKHMLFPVMLTVGILATPLKVDAKINEEVFDKKEYLKKAEVYFNSFVMDGPAWEANRIGEVNFEDIVEIYTQVTNHEIGQTFNIINYNGGIAYIPYDHLEEIEIYKEETIDSKKIKTPKYIILEGNIRKEAYKDLINSYNLIDKNIRLLYQIEGFKIKMTEKYIADEAYGEYGGWKGETRLNGAFDYEKKILFVNDENARHVVHEIGHYVNDRLKMFSDKPENKKLFETEASKVSLYGENNEREYYAECFSLYFRFPKYLKEVSPSSYNMIKKSLKEFDEIAKDIIKEHIKPEAPKDFK